MVVDDSADIHDLLKEVLSMSGHNVIEATNGQEAVEIARQECPDLIFMDLCMPVLDGYAATQQIREAAEICDVPIIACSAYATSDHRAKAFAVGCNEYITKPIEFTHLNNLLCRFLMAA
jgi:two-component system, cell cycle response regulator DivK